MMVDVPAGFKIVAQKPAQIPTGFKAVSAAQPVIPPVGGQPTPAPTAIQQFQARRREQIGAPAALGALGETPGERIQESFARPFRETEFGLSEETVQQFLAQPSEGALDEILSGFPDFRNTISRLVLQGAVSPVVAAFDLIGAAAESGVSGVSQALLEAGAFKGGDFEEATAARRFERDINEVLTIGGLFAGRPGAPRVPRARGAAAARETVKAGEEFGVAVRTTDVFPPQTFAGRVLQATTEKIPVIGTGGPRAVQQTQRQDAVTRLAREMGVNLDTPLEAGIIQSLNETRAINKIKAVGLRTSSVNRLNQGGNVGVNKALAAIDKELAREFALRERADPRITQNLTEIRNSIEEGNFEHVGNIRTTVINDINGLQRGDFTVLPSKAEAGLQRVKSAIDGDLKDFAQATDRQAGADWLRSNRLFAEEFTKFRNSELKRVIAKGDITPEVVTTTIFGSKRSELSRLFNNLDGKGRQNVRGAIIQRALVRAGYPDNINPDAFIRELNRENVRRATKAFFRGPDDKALRGFQRLLKATERAQQAAVSTPTGQQLLPLAAGGALVANPVITLSTAGTLSAAARIYESPPVRNALIKLASLQEGSRGFTKQLTKTLALMNSASQISERTNE